MKNHWLISSTATASIITTGSGLRNNSSRTWRRYALGFVGLFLLSALGGIQAIAQESPPPTPQRPTCDSADHQAFNFWLGEWDVYIADGRLVGHNTITSLYDGCALREEWRGAGGTLGTSLSFFDSTRGVWHQTWIDNAGRPLYLEGGLGEGGVMEMGVESERGVQKVQWTLLEDGRVRQHWAVSRDGGETWQVAFDGFYQKAGTEPPAPQSTGTEGSTDAGASEGSSESDSANQADGE